jgi:hypothetical protein
MCLMSILSVSRGLVLRRITIAVPPPEASRCQYMTTKVLRPDQYDMADEKPCSARTEDIVLEQELMIMSGHSDSALSLETACGSAICGQHFFSTLPRSPYAQVLALSDLIIHHSASSLRNNVISVSDERSHLNPSTTGD